MTVNLECFTRHEPGSIAKSAFDSEVVSSVQLPSEITITPFLGKVRSYIITDHPTRDFLPQTPQYPIYL
jgi:hypothetical protein